MIDDFTDGSESQFRSDRETPEVATRRLYATLRPSCGPFSLSLWSLCGPHPREHPRNPTNTGTAIVRSFGAFRPHSRIFAVLEANRGERFRSA
jgi:hypothetical protein